MCPCGDTISYATEEVCSVKSMWGVLPTLNHLAGTSSNCPRHPHTVRGSLDTCTSCHVCTTFAAEYTWPTATSGGEVGPSIVPCRTAMQCRRVERTVMRTATWSTSNSIRGENFALMRHQRTNCHATADLPTSVLPEHSLGR